MKRQRLLADLLEDGDGAALRRLNGRLPEAELVAWFRLRAARHLSRRSGRFWALVLDQQPPRLDPVREALWPL